MKEYSFKDLSSQVFPKFFQDQPLIGTGTNSTVVKALYHRFIVLYSTQYSNNPEDFHNAHNWLNTHPLFWIKETVNGKEQWKTAPGLQSCIVYSDWVRDSNGDLQRTISIRHGGHSHDYTKHIIDPRLTVNEETYEQAIVAMAKKVHTFYDLDGYER